MFSKIVFSSVSEGKLELKLNLYVRIIGLWLEEKHHEQVLLERVMMAALFLLSSMTCPPHFPLITILKFTFDRRC